MTFGDYVVTEAGFGADLGAEKFYNIKCRKSGLQPKLTIIVATAQGLKMHGGVSLDRIKEPNMEGLKEGFGNLDKHVRNLRSFGQQVIVAFNRFASDTDEEVEAIRRHCEEKLEVGFAVNNAFAKGGEGAVDLANLVVDTIENKPSEPLTFTYEENDCVERKNRKGSLQPLRSKCSDLQSPFPQGYQTDRADGYQPLPRLYRQDAVLLLCRSEDIWCGQ